jgi:hypothetical protein
MVTSRAWRNPGDVARSFCGPEPGVWEKPHHTSGKQAADGGDHLGPVAAAHVHPPQQEAGIDHQNGERDGPEDGSDDRVPGPAVTAEGAEGVDKVIREHAGEDISDEDDSDDAVMLPLHVPRLPGVEGVRKATRTARPGRAQWRPATP